MTISSSADLTSLFLVSSNAALLPSIVYAWMLGFLPEAAAMFTTFCVSVSYHLCQSHVFCVLPLSHLQVGDHFAAFSLIIWMMLFVSGMRLDIRVGVMFLFNYFIVLVMVGYMSSPLLQSMLFLAGIVVTGVLFWKNDRTHRRGRFYLYDGLALLLLLSVGLFLYAWHSSKEGGGDPTKAQGYWLRHSGWHLFTMFPLFLVLSTRVAAHHPRRGMMVSFVHYFLYTNKQHHQTGAIKTI